MTRERKNREQIRQRIFERRGFLARFRRKRYLHLKRTGRYEEWRAIKDGAKWLKIPSSSAEGSGIRQISWWQKMKNFILKLIQKHE